MIAAQKTVLSLAGDLTILNIQNLSKPDIEFHFDTRRREELFATVRAGVQRLEGFSDITTGGGEFAECIENSGISNIEEAMNCMGTNLSPSQSLGFLRRPLLSFWAQALSTQAGMLSLSRMVAKGNVQGLICYVSKDYSEACSLGFLRCSLLSFREQASSTHAEKFALGKSSFPCCISASIASIRSCGNRIFFLADLLLVFPLDIPSPKLIENNLITQYNIKKNVLSIDMCAQQTLICAHSKYFVQTVKITKPSSARTLTRLLTKPLIEVTVMAGTQHTQTRPKFQYRFLAIDRANRKATPCRLTVEAHTEQEARLILCAHFILSFAARLPAKGDVHA